MAMGMAITLGIREQYALAGIFMLTWATQTYGFLTECAHPFRSPPSPRRAHAAPSSSRRYISTPKAYVDKQNYKYPVGPYQLKKFAEGATDYGVTNYYEDPNALKLIDQTEWYSVRAPSSAPIFDCAQTDRQRPCPGRTGHVRHQGGARGGPRGAVSTWQGYSHVRSQRTANWLRRMVPHVFGWFTMTSVWFILFTQLEHARRDIAEVSDRNIPEWVFAAIIGTSLIFMSFALVRRARSNRTRHTRHAPQLTHPGAWWQVQIIFQRAPSPIKPRVLDSLRNRD